MRDEDGETPPGHFHEKPVGVIRSVRMQYKRSNTQKYADTLMTKAVIYFPVILYRLRKNQYRILAGLFTLLTTVATARMAMRLYRAHVLLSHRHRCRQGQLETLTTVLGSVREKVSRANMQTVVSLDIGSLQSQLHSGQLDPLTVLQCYQRKALEQNLKFNFIVEIVTEAEDIAKELGQSTGSKGLLYGLPVSVKEHIAIQGYDTHYGKSKLLGRPAADDSVIVKVLRHHGAIPFIRSNLPQLSHSYECSNPIVGQTVNPLDPSRSPGGSSGGEGAAMASGASILGIGSDLGGSIRVPAHYCGLCGLKPTYGRISDSAPNPPVPIKDICPSVLGPLSTDVAGVTLLCRALMSEQMHRLDRSVAPVPFREEMLQSTEKLRVGYYIDNNVFTPVPPVQRAVLEAVQILKDSGHEVVELSMDGEDLEDAIARIYCPARSVHRMREHWKLMKYDKIDPCIEDIYNKTTYPIWLTNLKASYLQHVCKDRFSAMLWRGWQGTVTATDWLKLQGKRNVYREQHLQQWRQRGVDVMLCPVTGLVAPPLGVAAQLDHPAYVYARLYNLIDFPAGVVPVTAVTQDDIMEMHAYRTDGQHGDGHKVMEDALGLPVGVQVVSLPFQEELCLRVMQLLEDKADYSRDGGVTSGL